MATVIRLKRRVDEDPLNAFVLNCKRQRVDGSTVDQESNATAEEGSSTILKFAGTFTKAEGIASHLQNIHKDQAKDAVSRVHRPNITPRNRLATKQSAQNSRFKIVNCTRSIANGESELTETAIPTTIVDVERDDIGLEEVVVTAGAESEQQALITPAVPQPAPVANRQAAQVQSQEPFGGGGQYSYENGVHYVYDLYVADTSQNGTHIPYFSGNLDELRLVLIEDAYFAFYSFI
ncbi:AGAP009067-PA-like protein [Anopheles sinensis]|uniref:AGAP009067-PA-like protein n=1 Tax=Anopheles sinensis TaxID=74873 RepID=A0A084W833_ANOSI|nr:AGAP009067-PA-like protein [Anopheles sinensis]